MLLRVTSHLPACRKVWAEIGDCHGSERLLCRGQFDGEKIIIISKSSQTGELTISFFKTAASGHLGLIYAGRAVAGFGIGSVSLQVPVYIAEMVSEANSFLSNQSIFGANEVQSPSSIRGRLVGIFEICSQGGGMLGFWINYAINRTISSSLRSQWQVPLGLQLLPGGLLLAGVFWCPESPRWYARKDRWEEAERSLTWVRTLPADHPFIQDELQQIRQQILIGLAPPTTRHSPWYYVRRLTQKGTRNRIGIGLLLMAFQNLTGVNIIT
jgi:MFS family permease